MILFLTWGISSVLLTWYQWIVTRGSTACGGSKVKEHQNVSRHFSQLFALPNAMAPKRAAELTTTGRRTKVAKMPQLKVLTSSSKAWPWVGIPGCEDDVKNLWNYLWSGWTHEKGGREMWIVRMELCDFKCFFTWCQGILRHGKRRHFLFQFCSGPMQNNDVLCFILRCRCTITVSDAASDMQDSTMLTIANMCSMQGCYNVNIGWTREAGCEENCRLLANTKDHLVIFSGTFRPLDIGLIITPEILESPQSLACLVLWLCGLSQPT